MMMTLYDEWLKRMDSRLGGDDPGAGGGRDALG